MTVKEIIVKYLKNNVYDGLYNLEDECVCGIDDLAPCGNQGYWGECQPGYRLPGNEHYDYLIGPRKEEQSHEEGGPG